MPLTIVLFEPQIPQNTGNVVRTCSVTGSDLILVRPFGFSISDRKLKRAGLDYWHEVKIMMIDDLVAYLEALEHPFYFFSSHADMPHSEAAFTSNDHLIFGSETTGLPPIFKEKWPDRFYTIPMKSSARCLNLANAATVVLYEALRQLNYESF